MTRKSLISAAIVVVAFGALVVVGFVPRTEQKKVEPPPVPVNVVVESVAAAEIADTIDLTGVVEANQVVRVSGEVAGIADDVKVKDGDVCKAGDLLVVINDEMIRTDVARAKIDLDTNKAQSVRIEKLFAEGAVTKKEKDDTCARVDMAQTVLDGVQARLNRTKISAPASGIINRVIIKKGEFVTPGVAVAEIADVDTVKVVVDLPELDVPFFQTGADATVLMGPDKTQQLQGRVTYISTLADQMTRTTRLEVAVDNRAQAAPGLRRSAESLEEEAAGRHGEAQAKPGDRRLHTGEITSVRLTRRVIKDAIMIPLLSVIPLEKSYEVFVVEDGKAQPRTVEFGQLLRGTRVQVTNGLRTGDRLIVSGHRQVAPGQAVNVVTPPTAEKPAGS